MSTHRCNSLTTAAATVNFLNENEVQLLPHAPYSPDRAVSLRLLPNPEVKKQVKGTLFESAEDARRAFTRAVEDIPRSAWDGEWNEWFYRDALCIAAEGSLFLLLLIFFFLL